MSRFLAGLVVGLVLLSAAGLSAAEFALEKGADGVTVKLDGKLFTRYLLKSGTKPILWPIIGPYGDEVTRPFPMRPEPEGKKADHPHQRSFWFTHGGVGGTSFWEEAPKAGQIVHQEFVKVASSPAPVIVARNEWIAPDGQPKLSDVRTVAFGLDGENVYIDFDIKLTASAGKTEFTDTKEGTFGLRVAETMRVDAKKGGRIINSNGQTDAEAWAKSAAWCDYYGPVNDKVVGIAILNHPKSFRYPTYWHVRTYGLYAANPFGLKDFTKGKENGAYTLEAGQSMSLYYRVLFHKGDEKQGQVAAAFGRYEKVQKP